MANKGENILLEARDKDDKQIAPKPSAKILGITVSNNLLWSHHLDKGKEAIIPKCKVSTALPLNSLKENYIIFLLT